MYTIDPDEVLISLCQLASGTNREGALTLIHEFLDEVNEHKALEDALEEPFDLGPAEEGDPANVD